MKKLKVVAYINLSAKCINELNTMWLSLLSKNVWEHPMSSLELPGYFSGSIFKSVNLGLLRCIYSVGILKTSIFLLLPFYPRENNFSSCFMNYIPDNNWTVGSHNKSQADICCFWVPGRIFISIMYSRGKWKQNFLIYN